MSPLMLCAIAVVMCALFELGRRRFWARQNDQTLWSIVWIFDRNYDFKAFMKKHWEFVKHGDKTGDYSSGVCHYYSLMANLITVTSGPFWHFVPMHKEGRKESHRKFHHDTVKYLEAKSTDKVLELGCGYGEMGRQVAKIAGSRVTGLTMADEEIVGGNQRIKEAGLEGQCNMVQGDYHKLPFEDGTFDKVFGIYTLKYSARLSEVINESARVLKPGGKFLSYEILVTDKYDPANKEHRKLVENISISTCMPPLHHARAFREAAAKAGLELCEEVDLDTQPGVKPWYTCFTGNGIHWFLSSGILEKLCGVAEAIGLLPPAFTEWTSSCVIHPTVDFVNGGLEGVISGAVMMTWTKKK